MNFIYPENCILNEKLITILLKQLLDQAFERDYQIWKENTRKQVLCVLVLYHVIEICFRGKKCDDFLL